MNQIITNMKILSFLQEFYNHDLPKLAEKLKDDFDAMSVEDDGMILIAASNISDGLLWETMEAAREHLDRNSEFFYDRKSGLVVSGIRWHEDFANALYFDAYPDFKDPEIMKNYSRLDVADYAMNRGWYSFMSTVGQRKMHYEFSPNFQEKMYFKQYLKAEY
jgi:hypothetical protein